MVLEIKNDEFQYEKDQIVPCVLLQSAVARGGARCVQINECVQKKISFSQSISIKKYNNNSIRKSYKIMAKLRKVLAVTFFDYPSDLGGAR